MSERHSEILAKANTWWFLTTECSNYMWPGSFIKKELAYKDALCVIFLHVTSCRKQCAAPEAFDEALCSSFSHMFLYDIPGNEVVFYLWGVICFAKTWQFLSVIFFWVQWGSVWDGLYFHVLRILKVATSPLLYPGDAGSAFPLFDS